MTKRTANLGRCSAAITVACLPLLAGCEGEEPPPPAPPPPVSRPAPEPDPISPLEEIEGTLDLRVQWPADREPSSVELAEAIAALANGLATGNASTIRPVLASDAAGVLSQLESSGGWERGVGSIEIVRVCSLFEDGGGCELALGVQDDEGAYLLAWRGEERGGRWKFAAIPSPPITATNVLELDALAMGLGGFEADDALDN